MINSLLPRDDLIQKLFCDVIRDMESPALTDAGLDPELVKRDFPVLHKRMNGHPLVWLDNAATTQKPQSVIDRLSYYYMNENSNVHRAAHSFAEESTTLYESARDEVARFINAPTSDEIIFVRGATEGINLIAQSWGSDNVKKGDEVLITHLEHHANIVPWQQLCSEKGAHLKVSPVDDTGQIILEEYVKLLNDKVRIVALSHASNAIGTVLPIKEMITLAHQHGIKVLIDGAQAISHLRVDVKDLNCDWYTFSGHKVFAPMGIGILFGKKELLDTSSPWQGGGNMISNVTFEKTTYQSAPARYEAGTGSIADAIGLAEALRYIDKIGIENITVYEKRLASYATEALSSISGLRHIGTADDKVGILSFVIKNHSIDYVNNILNENGIAVRSGHHCAQPILHRFGVSGTVRPSLAMYNTYDDINKLVSVLKNKL